MPGSEGQSGASGENGSTGQSSGSAGSSGPMSSSQLPDIGGGGMPGSSGGQPGSEGESGAGGEAGGEKGQEAGQGNSSGVPSWDENGEGKGEGSGSEWEKGSQLPEVPVDISAEGNGSGPSGVPGKKSGAAGELEDALEGIDGGIMAERTAIKDRASASPGGGGGRRSGSGLPGTGTSDSDGASGVGGTGGNTTNTSDSPALPDGVPTMARAPNAPARTAGVPKDVADARDDDVVARQLREAAMAETDPEIRAKLWADYQKYKKR